MKDFLKPTKKKGLLTLLLIVFYYISNYIGNEISGFVAMQFVSVDALMEVIEPLLPTILTQMGAIIQMVIVLFVFQFIFMLIIAYIFACIIVHMFKKK